MYTLVFDIETIPDVQAGRRLYHFEGTDTEVAAQLFARRLEETKTTDFLRLHLQKVAAISVVLAKADQVKVWSLGELGDSEAVLIQKFFEVLQSRTPELVSWNGSGFDLPVLHYRALINGVVAERYWETGEHDHQFRWNNYLNRYHYRHLDLMDVLAGYQAKANAPLDEIATLLGCPGKMGMSGSKVWAYYQEGKLEEIRNYCETDVLNTYLVYLHFQRMRGILSEDNFISRQQVLRDYLKTENKDHFTEFLSQCSNI
ncbi:3'-5' exonuclease [Candidatus Dependentiae bacterium]|nr:3'-5' exonuclease [Candidatus Dependentiae bacterium]